jgi:hypothetical protein
MIKISKESDYCQGGILGLNETDNIFLAPESPERDMGDLNDGEIVNSRVPCRRLCLQELLHSPRVS